jgi:Zn-dependent M28 family amino/carboxypeptidase
MDDLNKKIISTAVRRVFYILLLISVSWPATGQISAGKRDPSNKEPSSKMFDAKELLRDIETLAADDMGGRSADSPGMEKARAYVEQRLKAAGVEQIGGSWTQEFEFTPRRSTTKLKGVNFLGSVHGKRSPEKYIVITAHYDHDGIKNGEIYNGADDNASGTAALFALARYFRKNRPRHTMIFVAFDAEEKGLLGARHFVQNLPVPKESILLNVNMDMISRSDKGELYASGTYHYPEFKPILEKARKKAKVKLLLGHDRPEQGRDDWTFQSDHGAFHREKIPFIYFGVEDHEDYHKPTDDFERIHPEFYVRAVETVIHAIQMFDKKGS